MSCDENKMSKQPKSNDIPTVKATYPLERVHSDVCGPITPASEGGFKYIVNFVDEYSSMLFVYFIHSKDETHVALKNFISDVSPIGQTKELHTDNGGEYTGEQFEEVLRNNGIKHTTTSPYSSYQNGKSECNWRSLMDMARCLRNDASIPKTLWPYAVRHAQYLRNRSFQRRTNKTAYEQFCDRKPDLRYLYTFGSPCTALVEGTKQKLDARGYSGIYLGVNPRSNGYYVLNQNNRVITSRNVVVYEKPLADVHDEFVPEQLIKTDNENMEDTINDNKHGDAETSTPRYPQRERKPPKYLEDYVSSSIHIDKAYRAVVNIPNTYEEAVHSPDEKFWKVAMDNEIATLQNNDSWNLVKLPKDRDEIKGRWVYTLKQGKTPDKVEYKARYVAKGYSQISGVDYDETYSPTTKMTSIRMLLQKAVNEDFELHQMDVKGAYLNAPIDKEIYIQQPPGYELNGNGEKLSCLLNKSLYGLKQSGRNWHDTLANFLKKSGFNNNCIDPCVYMHEDSDKLTFVIFWVDDIIIGGKCREHITEVKNLLNDRFKMDDRGELKWFLAVDFKRTNDGHIEMSQERYIDAILQRFNMFECKPAPTPVDAGTILRKATDDEHMQFVEQNFPYRQAVGSLVYLAQTTRPDICWSVSKLSQFLDRPGSMHVTAIKHVLRYLKGTKTYSLTFKPSDQKLTGYVDSDWANDVDDRRSTSGYVFNLGSASVSWKTKKQPTVSLSSCEAEYMALSEVTKELLFLRALCSVFDMIQPKVSTVYCDNQGAIALSKESSKQHQRTKHIDVRYHFVRNCEHVQFEFVCSDSNHADIFTKSLGKLKHARGVGLLMIERGC